MHEEADRLISLFRCCARDDEQSQITVVFYDTDIFVGLFLVYYYHTMNLKNHVIMEPTSKDRTIVDIRKTVVVPHPKMLEGKKRPKLTHRKSTLRVLCVG